MRQYLKEIGIHSAIYSVSTVLTRAAGIILIPIYTRFLTTSDYGIISNVTSLINVFIILLPLGLNPALSRFFFDFEDKSEQQKSLFGTLFISLFISGLLINLFISFFGEDFFQIILPGLDFEPFILLAIWTAFTGTVFQFKINLLRVRKQSIQYGLFTFGRFLITIILTVVAIVHLGYGAIGKVASEFISWSIFFVIAIYSLWRDIRLEINWQMLKKALQYGLPTLPHSLSGVIISLVDKIFLTNLRGLGTVGVYTIGFQFGSVLHLILYSINLSWVPFFMNLAKEKGDEAKGIFARLTTYYVIVVYFLGLMISFFSKEIVQLFTTRSYYDSAYIVPIFVFSFVLTGFYYIISAKILYVKRAVKYLPLATLSSAALNVVLAYLLIDAYGMQGAAWARLISSILTFIIAFWISQIFYPIKYEYRRILVLTIIAACLTVVYLLVQFTGILSVVQFIFLKIVLIGLYFLILLLFHFFEPTELANLKDIYVKHRNKYLGR